MVMIAKPKIDPESPVPLYHQIAEALRTAIEAGDLSAGDALEPMRQAAEAWGVHLHTVRHAYAALARDGLVELRRGRAGTRVLGPAGEAGATEDLRGFLDRIEAEAKASYGLTVDDLVRALEDRATSFACALPRVHVVECSDWQCHCHAREIASRFDVETAIWPLHRSAEPPEGPVISTYFHYNDIRRRWPHRLGSVHFITIYPDPALRDELSGARRLVVYERDPSTAEAVAADLSTLFEDPSKVVEPRILVNVAALALDTEEAPKVLFAPRVWADLPPTVQQHEKAIELRYVLDPDELAELGRTLRWQPGTSAAA